MCRDSVSVWIVERFWGMKVTHAASGNSYSDGCKMEGKENTNK